MFPTRTAALWGVLTVCAAGCSHPLDDFVKGGGAIDTGVLETSADAALDSRGDAPADTLSDVSPDSTLGDADDDSGLDTGDATTDSGADETATDSSSDGGDTGPTAPEPGCTFAGGPAGSVCMPASDGVDLGAVNEAICGLGGCLNEQPQTLVKLSWFWIDEHEVSVGRFRSWWNTAPRPWPTGSTSYFKAGTKDLKWKGTWPSGATEPAKGGDCTWLGGADAGNDDKPINCVDWYTALGFCIADGGKRLPTEAEWEYVASGGQNRLFPWSSPSTENGAIGTGEPDCAHALFGASCPASTSSTSTVWGRTRYGVWNMSGGLAEWVLDAHTATWTYPSGTLDPFTDPAGSSPPPLRMARGGSYKSTAARDLRAAARPTAGVSATAQDLTIGFRCVKRI